MQATRALIFSYSDCRHYFAGTTDEPEGMSNAATFLKTADGKLRKFPSLYSAQNALLAMGYTQGWLVMHSPYDEMIGNEPARTCEMPLRFDERSQAEVTIR